MLDACIYVLRSGCSWRMLSKGFSPWAVVYRTFRRWMAKDLFEQMYDELRKLWRSRERRDADPTAGIVDSESAKTSPEGCRSPIWRRRRCPELRTSMSIADTRATGLGKSAPSMTSMSRSFGILATATSAAGNKNQLSLIEEIVTGFVVLPKRLIIERANAWNDRPRRMNKDHDRNVAVSAGWIRLAEGRRLLRRLTAPSPWRRHSLSTPSHGRYGLPAIIRDSVVVAQSLGLPLQENRPGSAYMLQWNGRLHELADQDRACGKRSHS